MTNIKEREGLADITEARVDSRLPKYERIAAFIHQLNGNPYHYICEGFDVTSIFPENAPPIEELLISLAE
jgi:hypothetical protein